MIRIKLPIHKHHLYPAPWVSRCDYCGLKGGYRKDGYRCYECHIFLHKECAKDSSLEIKHPSHLQHPLYLSFAENKYIATCCALCGTFSSTFYHCTICSFVVHTACARNPPPNVIEYPKSHEHSLFLMNNVFHGTYNCDFCEERNDDRYLYKFSQCQLKFHFECSNLPLEITYPCHPKHPVRFLTREEHHFSDGKCRICGKELRKKFYHCSICKFSVDVACVRDPPQVEILCTKAHEHQLNLMPRNISFTCDACGMNGARSPYACHQCDFMIHQNCVDLPEIINVNRHEHRLSRRIHLSPRNWVCGVCHQKVDWSYGAYSCLICLNYVIHCGCAIRDDVWDKLELKGIPEETQDIEPFKVIDENLICHFSHEEHYLKINEESNVDCRSIRCEACVFPIYSQAFYSCVKYDFTLHKTCANLPKKKRHVYHDKLLTLICDDMTLFYCSMCHNNSAGFRYTDFERVTIDVKCATLSDSIIHERHPCTLYYNYENKKICAGCSEWNYPTFSCDDCKFAIDFKCVVLPKKTEHWYDEHTFSLCYEKNMSGEYWCDMCEKKIDMTWFYTCDNCCVSFHTKCVPATSHFSCPNVLSHWMT